MAQIKNIACIADKSPAAQKALTGLQEIHSFIDDISKADILIVLGGDGFMLHNLHRFIDHDIRIFGMNCGTVGFLMNAFSKEYLLKRLENAKETTLHPLKMEAKSCSGGTLEALAFNEVSLLRETRQAAKLSIAVDGKERIEELVCDGALVSTTAGSTAYNFSAGGPILPMGSDVIALTPISPFRPRRWRGAVLPHKASIEITIQNPEKRPVSAVADFTEFRDVCSVKIRESRQKSITLLFDNGHSLEERILQEQFVS